MPGNNSQRSAPGNLPAKIKCSVCCEEKDTLKHFSAKQINDYKHYHSKSRNARKGDLYIRCKACVGGQPEEMTCRICRKTRAVVWFALAQRKDPDNARCRECMRATELVLPPSGNNDNNELTSHGGEASDHDERDGDHFYKDVAGEYWSHHDGDASSVSNPWSRQGSEMGYRGPISTKGSTSQYGDRDSNYSISATTTTVKAGKPGKIGALTLQNMAALNSKRDGSDPDGGKRIESLLRKDKGKGNATNDDESDSNKSDDTIKKDDGVSLPPKETLRVPNYEDDGEGEDYDDYYPAKPNIKKTQKSLYHQADKYQEEAHYPVSQMTGLDLSWKKTGSTQMAFGASTMSSIAPYALDASSITDKDWAGTGQATRTYASGFKGTEYRKEADTNNPRKFARVRPTNMRVTDLEKSLLHRPIESADYTGQKRNPADVDEDEYI